MRPGIDQTHVHLEYLVHVLLNINGTVFASNRFQEYKLLAIHTGVVPYTKIRDYFQELEITKHIGGNHTVHNPHG